MPKSTTGEAPLNFSTNRVVRFILVTCAALSPTRSFPGIPKPPPTKLPPSIPTAGSAVARTEATQRNGDPLTSGVNTVPGRRDHFVSLDLLPPGIKSDDTSTFFPNRPAQPAHGDLRAGRNMNSLNIISARVSPPASPTPTRTNSLSALGGLTVRSDDDEDDDHEHAHGRAGDEPAAVASERDPAMTPGSDDYEAHVPPSDERDFDAGEDTPLLSYSESKEISPRGSLWHLLPRRIASTFINSIRWVLSTLAAPGVYLIACLYDEDGRFAPLLQLRKLFGGPSRNTRKVALNAYGEPVVSEKGTDRTAGANGMRPGEARASRHRHFASGSSTSSGLSSESESDPDRREDGAHSTGRHARSKSLQDTEEIAPARRSIRIKLHADDTLRQQKHRKAKSTGSRGSEGGGANDISAQLKSPTSPVSALTKYPKTPAPPRPLIPRRQPSYINVEAADPKRQKTLILDLDETLIHSMSKGGRMSTGHMVEVRLSTTYVGVSGQASIGPQHPILYYVHKRPYCDDFLRRVSKWYNLVVFTASVQEYADPVIDWLESDRKYFSGRFYRQHCTFRHGAFIKDLSSVEPDLSKVMILDNSPLSYMFHQDNAIPIQGWISDPTDNDLLHLVPLLEGLQYVSDVRALLALRGGEDGQHMS
ncbi:hypothetical protein GQ53DRAFT_763782 [Thozetella sp. PMI_491]|nr:hypothetical protein GQ53DRAFT_763782 [Thozetella sp. PMI_491]